MVAVMLVGNDLFGLMVEQTAKFTSRIIVSVLIVISILYLTYVILKMNSRVQDTIHQEKKTNKNK